MTARAGSVYLVCRLGWRPGDDPRFWADLDYQMERRMVPVVACARPDTAMQRMAELDAEAFAQWTPYHFEGAATDMDRISGQLGFIGLRSEATDFDWHPRRLSRAEEVRLWWDISARHWSAERRAEVWPWVGPRLHRVLPVPFEE